MTDSSISTAILEKVARIVRLVKDLSRLRNELAKYYPGLYSITLRIRIPLGPFRELDCASYYYYHGKGPVCRATYDGVELVVFEDGSVSIYAEGVWRREDVEKILEALKANEKAIDEIVEHLEREAERLRTNLAATMLLS